MIDGAMESHAAWSLLDDCCVLVFFGSIPPRQKLLADETRPDHPEQIGELSPKRNIVLLRQTVRGGDEHDRGADEPRIAVPGRQRFPGIAERPKQYLRQPQNTTPEQTCPA